MIASVVWTLVLAFGLAVALVVVMAVRRRPEQGWRVWLQDTLGVDRSERTGPVAEHRDAADGETVSIADLLADAERAPGYVTVPAPIEHRIEAITEPIEHRIEAITEPIGHRLEILTEQLSERVSSRRAS